MPSCNDCKWFETYRVSHDTDEFRCEYPLPPWADGYNELVPMQDWGDRGCDCYEEDIINSDKPQWAYAPKWANYLAQDADNNWFWYENKPAIIDGANMYRDRLNGRCKPAYLDGKDMYRDRLSGRCKPAYLNGFSTTWTESLEKRP